MKCKLCPPLPSVEAELMKLVTSSANRGRPLPRFVLLGYATYSALRRELMGSCMESHNWDDLRVATPVGMISLAVDETVPTGMKCIPHAKHMRPKEGT